MKVLSRELQDRLRGRADILRPFVTTKGVSAQKKGQGSTGYKVNRPRLIDVLLRQYYRDLTTDNLMSFTRDKHWGSLGKVLSYEDAWRRDVGEGSLPYSRITVVKEYKEMIDKLVDEEATDAVNSIGYAMSKKSGSDQLDQPINTEGANNLRIVTLNTLKNKWGR